MAGILGKSEAARTAVDGLAAPSRTLPAAVGADRTGRQHDHHGHHGAVRSIAFGTHRRGVLHSRDRLSWPIRWEPSPKSSRCEPCRFGCAVAALLQARIGTGMIVGLVLSVSPSRWSGSRSAA